MRKILNFSKRNFKEVLRDPIVYIFCVGFPIAMLVLFNVINKYTNGNTPTFELPSLLPGIIMFSYTFVMLTMALLVSKDRQTFFLKRLYSSPMKPQDFILGYALVGLLVGILQTLVCVISAFVLSLITKVDFLSLKQILLLSASQFPILITFIFLGILFGTLFNDKSAPGVSSVFISLTGILGGCWMPLETMGAFENFCRYLPFYPSVYIGRIFTDATNVFGAAYTFDNVAALDLLPIGIFLLASVAFSFLVFKKNMISDE